MLHFGLVITRFLQAAALVAVAALANGQTSPNVPDKKVSSQPAYGQHDFVGCKPVSERTTEMGCWIASTDALGQLPQLPMFWHLDHYPTRAAAEAAKGSRGTVAQMLGKFWLLTIAEEGWRPIGGEHVADIGPLPIDAKLNYTAQYMEAIMPPGLETVTHRHPGPEAWYTENGETCLETPEGKQVGRKGFQVVVPGGQPMKLTVTGTEERRSVVLVLHDSSQAWTEPAHNWTPKGLCNSNVRAKPLLLEKNEGELRTRRIPTDNRAVTIRQFMLKVSPKNNGSQRLVLGTEELAPGATIPKHRHLGQDEILLIQSGTAHVWLGDQERDVHTGGLAFIPSNTWISLKNTGPEPISLTFVFSAPGFEDTMRCNSVPAEEAPTRITPEQHKECAHEGHVEYEATQEEPKK